MPTTNPAEGNPARHTRARHGSHVIRALLLFLITIVGVQALVGDRGLLFVLRARRQYDQLVRDGERLRGENARLRAEVRRLQEDPSAIEGIARRELGLIRPGEKAFIIKDIPSPETSRP
jgi:cell division protein FtsB